MKNSLLAGLVVAMVAASGCTKQDPVKPEPTAPKPRTLTSFDLPQPGETAKYTVNFEQAELSQVMKLYAEISGRSVIWATNLPNARITFTSQKPMTSTEALQALDTVLAAQEITTVYMGNQYLKLVPVKNATSEIPPMVDLKPDQLPDSSSFLMYVVKPRHKKASDAAKALQPFASLPNAILAINQQPSIPPSVKKNFPFVPDSLWTGKDDVLVLRDYSSNVKRMLKVLEQIDQP